MILENNVLVLVSSMLFLSLAIFSLHRSWSARNRDWRWVFSGWTALIFSVVVWGWSSTAEIGIPVTFLVLSFIAYATVLKNIEVRQPRVRRKKSTTTDLDPSLAVSSWSRFGFRVFAGGPLSLFGSFGAALIIFGMIEGPAANGAVIGMLTASLVFSVLMAWSVTDVKVSRPALASVLIFGVGIGMSMMTSQV